MKTASEIGNIDIYIIGNLRMRCIPVKGYTGSHIPLGKVVRNLISEVSDVWVYVPAVMCA